MENQEKLEILNDLIEEADVISKIQLDKLTEFEDKHFFPGISSLSMILRDKIKKIRAML